MIWCGGRILDPGGVLCVSGFPRGCRKRGTGRRGARREVGWGAAVAPAPVKPGSAGGGVQGKAVARGRGRQNFGGPGAGRCDRVGHGDAGRRESRGRPERTGPQRIGPVRPAHLGRMRRPGTAWRAQRGPDITPPAKPTSETEIFKLGDRAGSLAQGETAIENSTRTPSLPGNPTRSQSLA
jgi:hypothetical protein